MQQTHDNCGFHFITSLWCHDKTIIDSSWCIFFFYTGFLVISLWLQKQSICNDLYWIYFLISFNNNSNGRDVASRLDCYICEQISPHFKEPTGKEKCARSSIQVVKYSFSVFWITNRKKSTSHQHPPVVCNERYNSSDTNLKTFCCTKTTNTFHSKI